MMKCLVIFSNPPETSRLRLDREDKIIAGLARKYADQVQVERLHASEIDDIHKLVVDGGFDVIQFSGHGSAEGIFLDKSDLTDSGELVSAARLRSLVAMADHQPLLAVLLCCYANDAVPILADIAPFVVTAVGPVNDDSCLQFVNGFYERLFSGYGIPASFEHGLHLLKSRSLPADAFRLDRRCLIQRDDGKFAEIKPDRKHNSILVNLDAIVDRIADFGMSEEELCHLFARKLAIHYWIFDVPREKCLIPIGSLMFGEFSWTNAHDVVYCTRLLKLRSDVPLVQWKIWHQLLISYNDLASCEYRSVNDPAGIAHRPLLRQAVSLFQHNIAKYLEPVKEDIEKLGYGNALPYFEFVASHVENAADQLVLERHAYVVSALEQALTNYHELVDALRPPEEDFQPSDGSEL